MLRLLLPAAGDRTNMRAGHPSAAVGHLYFHMLVPSLRSYLSSYFRFAACSPELYQLATSSLDSSLELLAAEVQQTTARCVVGC